MYSDVEQTLFHAVIEPDMPGVEDSIAAACQKGANPDLVCVESSSSCGLVREGLTLLTYSIHEGNLEIVEVLLRSGADPDRVDQLGWSPWMASTVAADYRDEIQGLLIEHGARQEGGGIGDLCRAIYSGNVAAVEALQPSAQDFRLLAGFRVDLLRHQLICKQHDMFVYLVEAGMPYPDNLLYWTVRHRNREAAELLLQKGVQPDLPHSEETVLMLAAQTGDMALVETLVNAGADVNRYAFGNIEWTPDHYARKARHKEVAKWLRSMMDKAFLAERKQVLATRNPKFKMLYTNGTSGESLSTDDIVKRLEQWDQQYGVSVKRSDFSSLSAAFDDMPDDLEALLDEAIAFCPLLGEDRASLREDFIHSRRLDFWWD